MGQGNKNRKRNINPTYEGEWTKNKYWPWNWKYQESGMSGTPTGGIKIGDVELGEYKNLTSEGVRSSITGELVNQNNNNNNNNTNPPKGEWKNPWEGINKHSGRSGARQKLPANLRYPYSTIDDTQDFLRFSIFEYERDRKFISQGNRSLSGEQGNLRDLRDLLGSIILPIPAQLADTNSTGWGDSNVNQLESMAYEGADAAICIAISIPNLVKSSVLATKSVSQFNSNKTPTLEPGCIYDTILPSFALLPAFF